MNACGLCSTDRLTMIGLPVCSTCFGEVAVALDALPGLLAGLEAITGRTLARPSRDTPAAPGSGGPSTPAHEAVIDLRTELSDTVTEWAACVDPFSNQSPTWTLTRHLSAALAMTGGDAYAGRLLHLTDVGRRRLDPPDIIRMKERCPACHTRGLVAYDTGGPAWCLYCHAESYPAA